MWYGTVGINALTLVAQVKPEVAQQYQMVVIECLDDPDDILRRKVREDCFILVSLHLPTFTHHYHHLHLLPSSSYPLTITFTPTHHHPHIHSPSPSHPLTIVLTSTHHHPHIQSPSSSHPLTIIKSTHHHPHSHPLTITLTSTHYHPHIHSPSSSPLTSTSYLSYHCLPSQTMDLLYQMTNPTNVEVITERMLSYLRTTHEDFVKKDIVAKITKLAERFSPNNIWFMKTMNEVFELEGNLVRPDVAHNLMRLIAEG